MLGVYFKPESGSDTHDRNGELTLGGVDSTKYTGALRYFPKTTVSPFSFYWGIDVASVTYGRTKLLGFASAIVDTGTTLIYIPTSAYNRFLSATGGTTDPGSGFAEFSTKPTGIVTFTFGRFNYPLTPSQYLVPKAQYGVFGLSNAKYYSWVCYNSAGLVVESDGLVGVQIGGLGDSGVDFFIGQKFLENYVSARYSSIIFGKI